MLILPFRVGAFGGILTASSAYRDASAEASLAFAASSYAARSWSPSLPACAHAIEAAHANTDTAMTTRFMVTSSTVGVEHYSGVPNCFDPLGSDRRGRSSQSERQYLPRESPNLID